MRKRIDIEKDPKAFDKLILETLLDLRDLLLPKDTPKGKKRGRPRKIK